MEREDLNMKQFLWFVFLSVSVVVFNSKAQLSVSVQMLPFPSPYISDWKSNPNTITFVVTNPTGMNQDVRFNAYIEGLKLGKVAQTKLDANIPPVVIPPGTSILNAIDARLLDEAAIQYIGSTKEETQKSGRLPEDNFKICVQLVTYALPNSPLSPDMCSSFQILLLQPPSLINPKNISEQKSLPTFQWSIVPQVQLVTINYELTVIELEAGQTNPGMAMQTNIPLFQRTTSMPLYVLLQSDPQLVKGRKYVWRVRAFDQQGKYSFANNGFSEIWTFTYNPVVPPVFTPEVTKSEIKTVKTDKPGYGFVDVPMKDVLKFIVLNSTVKGKLFYTFEKSKLFAEHKVGSNVIFHFQQKGALNHLPNVALRLVKRYKVIPQLNFYSSTVTDTKTWKTYSISPKTVATTTADAGGNFTFKFIEGDSTVILKNASLQSGGGEFVDYVDNGTLYKYYTVEVINPYYCSSQHEIACEPGETVDVSLSSLVRTYNLDVTVKDKERGTEVGSLCNVYIARFAKSLVPFHVPYDEGELESPSGLYGIGQVILPEDIENPKKKFTNSNLGYVIGMRGTEDAPIKGHAVFTRLVRNLGGVDQYVISARTPEKKLDGNYNDLYYFDNNKGVYFMKKTLYDKPGDIDPGYDYSGDVIYNSAYTIKTFSVVIKIVPRLPRIFGRVKRSDSKKDIKGAVVRVERNPAAGNQNVYYDVTNTEGKFEVHDIQPSGTSWAYNIRFLKYGFKTYQMSDRAMAKGYQTNLGTIELDPKLIVTRTVIDEHAKLLPGVEGILGDGAKRYTNENGVFASPAIPGFQHFHLEKKPKYADKDSNLVIQDNPFGEAFGAILADKIVMFEAKRRLEVRVLDQTFTPIQGAKVLLEDHYITPSSDGKGEINYQAKSMPYQLTTNEKGIVSFAYLSPSSQAKVKISVPNSDYVSTKRTYTDVQEGGTWTKKIVILQAGGRVKGIVYIGEKKAAKSKQGQYQYQIPQEIQVSNNLPCANARVWIEGYPDLRTFTNSQGEYDLRGVPVGSRIVRASRSANSADSQAVGAEKNVIIKALQTHEVNLYLAKYNGMDITKLLGFPVEIDKLTELANGNIKIDGAFASIPSNSKFKLKDGDARFEFINTELTKYGEGNPPPAKPVSNSVRVLDTKIDLLALSSYPVELRDGSGIPVAPPGSDFTKGRFNGKCNLDVGSFSINTNELELKDENGVAQKWYLGIMNSDPNLPPVTIIGALTSEGGTFDSNGEDLRIANATGGDSKFKLNTYNAVANAKESYLAGSGVHLQTAVHVTVDGCGSGMNSTCDVALQLGDVLVKKSGLDPLDPTKIAAQDIPLQMWQLHAQDFGLSGVYFTFDGGIKAPLVQNVVNDETKINIPFTGMQLRPTEIWGGTFSFTQLDMLGVAMMDIINPTQIGSDSQSWFVTTSAPEIRANQGGGKFLEGLDPAGKIILNTFYLRSDGTKDISASEDDIIVHKVGSFKLNSFQFGYDTKPYMTMQGSLTLINIPDLSPQFTRIYYIPGGKFGMDGVFFAEPYVAGGVKITIANGMLTPEGFIAEGDWGNYRNQIILEDQYKLNMWFRHRKVGSEYSTIAEIINSDHAPPQTQNLFKNTSAPDVKNVYGRTQLEPGLVWSTKFCGWYQTSELAAPDSMYYTVEGTGGNGTIAVAKNTMKMKGTTGGLGMLMNGYEEFPKGPAPFGPPVAEESPFSDMDIHVDLQMMALIMSVHVEKEISPGTGFKGDITSVISFGSKKFWFFLAAGEGKVSSPKCEGKAVFLAGVNYDVTAADKQLVVDYSISGRELPNEFATMNGFFTQVAVVMPIPGAPNFSVNFGIGSLTVECAIGGEARLGLNFGESTTFFFGVYATAWIKVDCEASLTIVVVGVKLKAHLLVQAGAGGWFTYNSDAGASFDILGFIIGQLDFSVCLTSFGAETCGDMTLFKLGGEVEGRIGAGEYMEITPTFEFLGLNI